jgi:hypothetical protein
VKGIFLALHQPLMYFRIHNLLKSLTCKPIDAQIRH